MKIRNPITFSAVVILLMSLTSGCVSDSQVISQATEVHAGLAPAVIDDPELSGYVQTVGDRIIVTAKEMNKQGFVPESGSPEDNSWMFSDRMQFHLVSSNQINAFTTGGEHMYVYTELFSSCKSEDELAAVMSHEFAHVFGRHVHSAMNKQYAILGLAATAGVVGFFVADEGNGVEYATTFAGATAAAGEFIGMSFTRDDEREADLIGFDFYVQAGWDPYRFGDFFQRMIDQGYDTTPEIVSDHPSLASRVQESKEMAAKLPPAAAAWRKPPVATPAMFKRLQDKTRQLTKNLPKDDSLSVAMLILASFPNCLGQADTEEQKTARKTIETIRETPEKPK